MEYRLHARLMPERRLFGTCAAKFAVSSGTHVRDAQLAALVWQWLGSDARICKLHAILLGNLLYGRKRNL